MNRIQGLKALVTGGTKGIGLAIAEALSHRGALVCICARNPEGVSAATELLSRSGSDVKGIACDVRRSDQVRDMFTDIERDLGGLDVLVNNAGVGSGGAVEETSDDQWLAVIETNLSGVFYCCREAVPLMKKRGGGFIVNIGSLAGKNGIAGAAAYCASKFGLIGFSESLMQEVRGDHIRVSCVMPGSVNTGFSRRGEDPSATWKLLPDDVARAVTGLIEADPRALLSRVEIRPSEPRR